MDQVMVALVLAAMLWQAPPTIRVPSGETWTAAIPAVTGPARLVLRPRADYWRRAGSNTLLRIHLNGRVVGLMRDRRTARLVNHAVGDGNLRRFDAGWWPVAFAPSTAARDEIALDVGDLLRADAPNRLVVESRRVPPGDATAL